MHRVAGHIQIEIRHHTAGNDIDPFLDKPQLERLDDRVILVIFGVENPFKVFDARRQAEAK